VLAEIDEFLAPGSHIEVTVDADLVDPAAVDGTGLANAKLTVHAGTGGPEQLLGLAGEAFDSIVVLGYRAGITVAEADARTLLTLLTLRKVWPAGGPGGARIVAELLDQTNVAIASTTGVDDFIVSDALTSLVIAQLSERAELQAVFDDLFDAEGVVVELRPAASIVPPGTVPFAAVVVAATAHRATAIGYRVGATGAVVVNPPKAQPVTLGADDQVLVIGHRAARHQPWGGGDRHLVV
jgi:hypothetical protein